MLSRVTAKLELYGLEHEQFIHLTLLARSGDGRLSAGADAEDCSMLSWIHGCCVLVPVVVLSGRLPNSIPYFRRHGASPNTGILSGLVSRLS